MESIGGRIIICFVSDSMYKCFLSRHEGPPARACCGASERAGGVNAQRFGALG